MSEITADSPISEDNSRANNQLTSDNKTDLSEKFSDICNGLFANLPLEQEMGFLYDLGGWERKSRGLSSIIEELKKTDTPTSEPLEASPRVSPNKAARRRRLDRPITNGIATADFTAHNNNNNNNNNLKNERLSPGTTDTSSRSRSVTPSSASASHPDTPPAAEQPFLALTSRNYSDFMRSLAAKYNNTNPNDYFTAARNGFLPQLDTRFKSSFSSVISSLSNTPNAPNSREDTPKKPELSVLNPFATPSLFPPFIDMSSTQALLAMVRAAKDAELQGLAKSAKRPEPSSPLDLSAAARPPKRRAKTPLLAAAKRAGSESPRLQDDVAAWTVEDVCGFVEGIDICAEYAHNFREQRIDGSGLPLLTEEHLTSTMNMKLGPALKLKSVLAKKLGSCSICLHCSHCHRTTTGSPDPGQSTGCTDAGGGPS